MNKNIDQLISRLFRSNFRTVTLLQKSHEILDGEADHADGTHRTDQH